MTAGPAHAHRVPDRSRPRYGEASLTPGPPGGPAVREENAAAALEVMSRFAVDPRLLAYLPPTMAPCATSQKEGYLGHPAEAFAGYRADGVARVVCEEKHMGSRAVALVCRDEKAAEDAFGVTGATGVLHTRTGRPSFGDPHLTEQVPARLRGRHLGHRRSLALREHALGLEALDRRAAGEPLWRVHEAVFAVPAVESEPVDPRL